MTSCRELNARQLEEILRKTGPTTMGDAATLLNRGVRYTRSLIDQFPGRLEIVGAVGPVSAWRVAVVTKKETSNK